MNNLTINNNYIAIKEYEGQRVVTLKDVDMLHERPNGTARRNFNSNKAHLIEGEDYFKISSNEIRTKNMWDIDKRQTQDVVLLTESGYLMLAKSLTDDKAWKVQRQLVNCYFKVKEDIQPQQMKLPETKYEYKLKYYKGQVVITYADIEYFTNIPADSFKYQYYKKKNKFDKDLDFWLLQGADLVKFKRENNYHARINSLMIFTESGFMKLVSDMNGVKSNLECFSSNKEETSTNTIKNVDLVQLKNQISTMNVLIDLCDAYKATKSKEHIVETLILNVVNITKKVIDYAETIVM